MAHLRRDMKMTAADGSCTQWIAIHDVPCDGIVGPIISYLSPTGVGQVPAPTVPAGGSFTAGECPSCCPTGAVAATPIKAGATVVPLNTGDTLETTVGGGLALAASKTGTTVTQALTIPGLVNSPYPAGCATSLILENGVIKGAAEKGGVHSNGYAANLGDITGTVDINTGHVITNPFCQTHIVSHYGTGDLIFNSTTTVGSFYFWPSFTSALSPGVWGGFTAPYVSSGGPGAAIAFPLSAVGIIDILAGAVEATRIYAGAATSGGGATLRNQMSRLKITPK